MDGNCSTSSATPLKVTTSNLSSLYKTLWSCKMFPLCHILVMKRLSVCVTIWGKNFKINLLSSISSSTIMAFRLSRAQKLHKGWVWVLLDKHLRPQNTEEFKGVFHVGTYWFGMRCSFNSTSPRLEFKWLDLDSISSNLLAD